MLTRETRILGWARRHRYAALALIAACALLAPTIVVALSSHLLNETFIATDIVGTSTITTPSYVVTGGTTPTITVCTTDPPTAIAPLGSICIDSIPTPSTLYQSQGAGSWTLVGGAAAAPTVGQFGDASDGNVTIAADTSLTRDMFYNNLTVNVGATLNEGGFRVFVAGLLTINGKISDDGGVGGNASGALTGGAGIGAPGGSLSPGQNGGAGFNNGCCVNGIPSSPCFRGLSAAGAGGGNTGGIGGAGGTCVLGAASSGDIRCATCAMIGKNVSLTNTSYTAGAGGGGGAGGSSCAGGGGGGGGGYNYVAAKTWTGGGSLTANGGNGGNGATGCSAGIGSSGGGGGAGGVVVFTSQALTAPIESINGGIGGAGNGGNVDFSNGRNGGLGLTLNFIGN